jgi:hypothetical protein
MLGGSFVTTAWCVADEDSHQLWRVAANILNKQLQTAGKE